MTKIDKGNTAAREIEYLSAPAKVSMADSWFDISATDHFWFRRRFEVFRKLAGGLIAGTKEMAEIGCGHGLLQRQIEDVYGREVTGFDLNEYALKRNVSRRSKVYCYDILQREPALRQRFDLVFLFDVIEHIRNAGSFLDAVLFHMAPEGRVVVNVPAGQWLFSRYDEAAGHVCRYSIDLLEATASLSRLQIERSSYWGLPLVPVLMARRLWLMGERDEGKAITTGFDSRSPALNKALWMLASCEPIPHKLLGTSLVAVLRRADAGSG